MPADLKCKKKPKKRRNMETLGMILTRKGGRMSDKRSRRKSGKNVKRELLNADD